MGPLGLPVLVDGAKFRDKELLESRSSQQLVGMPPRRPHARAILQALNQMQLKVLQRHSAAIGRIARQQVIERHGQGNASTKGVAEESDVAKSTRLPHPQAARARGDIRPQGRRLS